MKFFCAAREMLLNAERPNLRECPEALDVDKEILRERKELPKRRKGWCFPPYRNQEVNGQDHQPGSRDPIRFIPVKGHQTREISRPIRPQDLRGF